MFVKIMYGRKAWLGEHNINGAELAFIAVTSFAHSMRDTSMAFGPTLRSHACIKEITADIDGTADGHSDEHSEVADEAIDVKDLDEEVVAHDDEAAPIDEHDFEDVEVTDLRDGLPEYKGRESDVNKFMLFLP